MSTASPPATEAEPVTSIFDSIPDDYGGPAPEPKPPVEDSPEPDPSPELESTPAPEAEETTPDPEQESQPKKTPGQIAQERRESKAEKNRKLKEYDSLLEQKKELETKWQDSQAQLDELRSKTEEIEFSEVEKEQSIEVLQEQLKQAEQRYIAAHAPTVDPYQDEQVVSAETAVTSALRSNIPRMAPTLDGSTERTNFDALWKDPSKRQAVQGAVFKYMQAAEKGDNQGMNSAVEMLGGTLGDFDTEDDSLKIGLENALAAASDPMAKGIQRVQEVRQNAESIAMEQRAAAIKQTQNELLAPLRFNPEQVEAALEENPSNGWANFGKLVQEMPEDFRKKLDQEVLLDAQVVAQMQFQPPPLPANADQEAINKHHAVVQASQQRAHDAAKYLAVGRAVIDGGIIAHLRAEALSANSRLEEQAESEAIPGGEGGGGETDETLGGIYANVPDQYMPNRT